MAPAELLRDLEFRGFRFFVRDDELLVAPFQPAHGRRTRSDPRATAATHRADEEPGARLPGAAAQVSGVRRRQLLPAARRQYMGLPVLLPERGPFGGRAPLRSRPLHPTRGQGGGGMIDDPSSTATAEGSHDRSG